MGIDQWVSIYYYMWEDATSISNLWKSYSVCRGIKDSETARTTLENRSKLACGSFDVGMSLHKDSAMMCGIRNE